MAKKDKNETPPPTPPQIQQPNLGRGEESVGYTVGLWAWKTQYVCKTCQFDTLQLGVMEEHLMLVHGNFKFQEPTPASSTPPDTAAPLSANNADEVADGIFEIDLKEDQ